MEIRNLQSLLVCSIKSLHHWRWLNLWLTVLTGIEDLDLVLSFHSSPLWTNEAAPRSTNSIDAILEDKVLSRTQLDLQKTFSDIPCESQMLWGPSLRLDNPIERLSIPPGTWWIGNDTGRLVTCECPLRTDSAFLKLSWIIHTIDFILQFLYLAKEFQDSMLIFLQSSPRNCVECWALKSLQFLHFTEAFLMSFTKIPILLQYLFITKLLILSTAFFCLSTMKFFLLRLDRFTQFVYTSRVS